MKLLKVLMIFLFDKLRNSLLSDVVLVPTNHLVDLVVLSAWLAISVHERNFVKFLVHAYVYSDKSSFRNLGINSVKMFL